MKLIPGIRRPRLTLQDEMIVSGGNLFRWRSYLPLLFVPLFCLALYRFRYPHGSEALDNLWDALCVGVAVIGIALRALTVGHVPARTSGRNTVRQKADSLNITGMYSVVRHPLYLGNLLIWLGLALFTHSGWFITVALLAFWLYYERIMLAEEHYLDELFGDAFRSWAERTPAFVPDFRLWTTPDQPFSWKAVLARENAMLFSTILSFFLLEVTGDYFAGKMPRLDLGWALFVGTGMFAYAVLRWMKRHNRLHAPGR